ncbi:uncharacterized protein PV09_06373 [Verruconis gallopava]|uniref:Uncharacterized protein n=1 Tax=Verruconis gallopava TaxID=253628 RepID=A0A0D2ASS8_9PEZI|nr:uncharacterized protein PV09_06373 [Verruconis gallopava]KIW02219.1 hypothetical protein PV09_06373 [Verruconis gallopava]
MARTSRRARRRSQSVYIRLRGSTHTFSFSRSVEVLFRSQDPKIELNTKRFSARPTNLCLFATCRGFAFAFMTQHVLHASGNVRSVARSLQSFASAAEKGRGDQ